MPRWWAAAMLAVSMSGCGDSHEAVATQQIANLKELTAILREVKDSDSLNSSEAKIEARAGVYRETARRGKALSSPSDAELQRLSEKIGELQSSLRAFQAEAARVAALPGGPEFIERIQKQAGMTGAAR